MVRGENHIFFDISDADFSIAVCNPTVPTGLVASNILDGFCNLKLGCYFLEQIMILDIVKWERLLGQQPL